MRILQITSTTTLSLSLLVMAAHGQETPASSSDAREAGRLNSRFLDDNWTRRNEDEAMLKANVETFNASFRLILKRSCVACHGPDRSEGRLRVDELNPDLLSGPDTLKWREIYKVLGNSEMPPADEPDYSLSEFDRGRLVEWLSEELEKASRQRKQGERHSSFRRMTRSEYGFALQDALGLPWVMGGELPPEATTEDGFERDSALLQMSVEQFVTYREIGLKALERATVRGARPKPVVYRISMNDEFERLMSGKKAKTFQRNDDSYVKQRNRQHLLNRETGVGIHFSNGKSTPLKTNVQAPSPDVSDVVLALPRSSELKWNLDRFLPDEGVMRVRVRAGRSTMNPQEFASLRLIFSAHTSNNANFTNVISEYDVPVTAPASDPEYVHFDIPLADIQRNPFRKLSTTFPRRDEFLHIRNVSNAGGGPEALQVLIDHIEIIAPFYEQWPPKSHSRIFFDRGQFVDEQAYGREVLKRFLRLAWRRPVSSRDIDPFMRLFAEYRSGMSSFEQAMVEVLATVLASPEFLYLTQRDSVNSGEEINDFELASRLAMFIWSSIPDEQLIDAAERHELRNPEILDAQLDRMLSDPRSRRFSTSFVRQWLGLRGIDSVVHVTDDTLKAAMLEEPVAFFHEVLNHNLSVIDFVDSDYVMLNERLAKHYGIPLVYGPHFRRVSIGNQHRRGGLLTTAACLTMNSDGKDSHPLKRGVWLLERILNDPPPPPPPNVPEVDLTDPEILKMTLKERIADHRNQAACRSCHARIDPWGIAFENYDALGAFRTQVSGVPVDAVAELFSRHELDGIDGLKRFLLMKRQDQFVLAMVHKMTAFALGRPLTFADDADIQRITARFRRKGDGLRDLVSLIVTSKIFQSR